MTRFYAIVLIIILTIIFLLLTLPVQRKVVSVLSPSLADYQRLYTKPNLQCSCSRLAIPYSTFLPLTLPTFHQVCSSDFVSLKWISLMFSSSNIRQYISDAMIHDTPPYYRIVQYPSTDFRSISSYLFHLLAELCQMTNSIIIGAFEELAAQYFVNSFLLSQVQFNKHITLLFDQLKQTASTTLVTNLRLIRLYIHGNALFPVSASNWQFFPTNITQYSLIHTKPVFAGSLSVGLNIFMSLLIKIVQLLKRRRTQIHLAS